ncbi:hypothetical protein HanLR1_Chr09g0309051 [Helianthus annuus]|nr:hypothetical protein HanHA89_Chr09g0329611 [Helianthus annuus]KAJ0706616.1 hypothetical protein HanLR1_Chr09g0309051 [Helianthus annuus]
MLTRHDWASAQEKPGQGQSVRTTNLYAAVRFPQTLLSPFPVGPTTTLISENSSPSSNHSPSRPAFSGMVDHCETK